MTTARPTPDDAELREQIAQAFSQHEPTNDECDAALVCSAPEHLADAVLAVIAPLLDRLAALAQQVEQVRALVDAWAGSTCQTDGAPCSWHRVAAECALDIRAALDATHNQEGS